MNGNKKKSKVEDVWAMEIERKLNDTVNSLRIWIERHEKNREIALTLTKLEEGQMWFARR